MIVVSEDDPAFMAPEKFIGPVYSPEEQTQLEANYGWHMKRDGKYLCGALSLRQNLARSLKSDAIKLLLKEGHVVICSGVAASRHWRRIRSEAVIDKDRRRRCWLNRLMPMVWLFLTDADAGS